MSTRSLQQIRLFRLQSRYFTSRPRNQNLMGKNPPANQPDSNARDVRKDTPNTDEQSNASKEEHKSGDDHPAKQPDPQAAPTRSTGIGGSGEVKGGKEGLGDRK